MRFLLDEHLSPTIAASLRRLGVDAASVAERDELRGMADHQLWAMARTEDRAIVTMDAADFLPLASREILTGAAHPGLVLLAPGRFSTNADDIGRVVTALCALASVGTRAIGVVTWLEGPPA